MYTLSGDIQCTHILGTFNVHTFWGHSMYTISGDIQYINWESFDYMSRDIYMIHEFFSHFGQPPFRPIAILANSLSHFGKHSIRFGQPGTQLENFKGRGCMVEMGHEMGNLFQHMLVFICSLPGRARVECNVM